MANTRNNKSKYNFGTLSKGDVLEIDPLDAHNMYVSLKAFNKYHGRDIELELVSRELNKDGMIEYKAVKV